MNIVHVVRLQLTWFVNTLLHHLGVVVRPPDPNGRLSYVTLIVMRKSFCGLLGETDFR